jgi:hypothetical protein
MRLVGIIIGALALVGCETPSSVQRVSDYEICRLSILRPPLQSAAAISEADRQIRVRGVNCGAYAGTILQQQQQGLEQMQQGLRQMQQNPSVPQQQNRTTQMTINCTRMGDMSRRVHTFNAIACPVGYAPSY